MVGSKSAIIFQLILYSVVLSPALTFAQISHRTGREGFSGQKLFEHEWKWIVQPEHTSNNSTLEKKLAMRAAQFSQPEEIETELVALGDGLGPMHNATSCAECHVGGGSSGVEHNVTLLTIDPRSDIVARTEDGADRLLEFFPALLGADGTLFFNVMVHNHSTREGYDQFRNGLAEHVSGGIDDSWFVPEKRRVEAIASQPVIAGRYATIDFYLSQRNPPPLFGLGRIDLINPNTILAIANRRSVKSNGTITGRFAGKFGWQGQGQSLSGFVADACAVELGLAHGIEGDFDRRIRAFERLSASGQQAGDPADSSYVNSGVDLTHDEFTRLASYVASIPQPIERADEGHTLKDLLAGEKSFFAIGCEMCHVADVQPVQGLFSDLLLHDMGPALQAPSPAPIGNLSGRVVTLPPTKFIVKEPQITSSGMSHYGQRSQPMPVFTRIARPVQPRFPRGETTDVLTWDALQREWRTPPLWGIADTAPYLHDGRTATLEEAIMWHAGEAESAKKLFLALSRYEKDLVLAFLSSLRAPKSSD